MNLASSVAALSLLSLLAGPSLAVQIQTTYTQLQGSNWKVDLALSNGDASLVGAADPTGAVSEFTVFFPYASFTDLQSLSAPAAWDPLAVQPDSSPSDGYLDYLIGSGRAPLAVGGSASGFSIGFHYAGSGTPGALRYAVVDPDTFATLYQGNTVAAVSAVPEPTTGALLLLGLGGIAWHRGARAKSTRVDAVRDLCTGAAA